MGLFRRKKKVVELPPPPIFPEISKGPLIKPLTKPKLRPIRVERKPLIKPVHEEKFLEPITQTHMIREPIAPRTIRAMPGTQIQHVRAISTPLFVKIEKFRAALEALETIKVRLKETSEMLDKLKETRAREQQELSQWEREIEEIKKNINTIDEKLFQNL